MSNARLGSAIDVQEDLTEERTIEITLNSVENVLTNETINVSFRVEHNDNILGESDWLIMKPDFGEPATVHDIEFAVKMTANVNDRSSIDRLVSTPVLVKMVQSIADQTDRQSLSSETELKKRTKFTAKQPPPVSSAKVIGMCSLDLMPIFLGERCFTEKLIVETPQYSFDSSLVPWRNLPQLTVTMTQSEANFFPRYVDPNFMCITVESIYNPPSSFVKEIDYKIATVVYVDDKTTENIVFEGGVLTTYRDVEKTKRWQTLNELRGRARLSKYKLCHGDEYVNEIKQAVDLEGKMLQDAPRVEWNAMYRCLLLNRAAFKMQEDIIKYRYWPFVVAVTHKNAESGKAKTKEGRTSRMQLYQCYADISELLFPGRAKTRVVAQLYTYNLPEMKEKTGLGNDIFSPATDNDRKNKAAPKSVRSDVELAPSTELTNENGEPVFVIIEFSLYRPLVASRIVAEFSNLLKEFSIEVEKKPPYPHSSELAEEQYADCIKKLVQVIVESYADFREGDNASTNPVCEYTDETARTDKNVTEKYSYDSDELTRFTRYLHRTGTYLAVRSALKAKVGLLLDQKFRMSGNTLDSPESQNFITAVYSCLVERMHVAINKTVEGRTVEESLTSVSPEKMYFYADEAYELGRMDRARDYHLDAIMQNKNDPRAWTKYAIFLLKTSSLDRAVECCREAIHLNSRDRIALLMYGVILAEKRRYRQAEIFLRTITEFYPRFAEGWAVLHLFYIRTEYYPGIDLTIRVAEKCMKDTDRDTEILEEEPLAWSMVHCPRDSVYTVTATFLLKLHLCDFAGISLAQEMSVTGRSLHVLYYMAVEHYLSSRFEDALSHLKEMQLSHGMDYSISSLMGHCHLRIGNSKETIGCYEFADSVFNRPEDLHLVHQQMGQHYEDAGRHSCARRAFLSACKSSPTCRTWLGAGKAFYNTNRYEDAEMALTEANRIDNRDAEVWGYLCLLNMALERYHEFCQCYRQTVKNNLKNVNLWRMITSFAEALGYKPATVSTVTAEAAAAENNAEGDSPGGTTERDATSESGVRVS